MDTDVNYAGYPTSYAEVDMLFLAYCEAVSPLFP